MQQPPRVLEVRVHGVSGTPPHAMLGVLPDQVQQVAGDRLTGYFRPVGGVTPSGAQLPDDTAVEAYSWGALTSSGAGLISGIRRALWLVLLPFALVNMAMWARRGMATPTRRHLAAAVLVRWAGLLLTSLLVATVAGLGVDLLAWQCFRGGQARCSVLPSWTQLLASDWFAPPARRMLVGSLLPLAVLALLAWLTRQSIRRYEAVRMPDLPAALGLDGDAPSAPPAPAPPETSAALLPTPHLLERPEMWEGGRRTTNLARLHLSAALAMTVLATAWPLSRVTGTPIFDLHAWAVLGIGALTLALAAVGVFDQVEYAHAPQRFPRLRRLGPPVTLGLAGVLLLGQLAALAVSTSRPGQDRNLPGTGQTPLLLLLALFFLTAMLVGVLTAPRAWPVAVAVAALPLWWVHRQFDGGARFWANVLVLVVVAAGLTGVQRWSERRTDIRCLAWAGAAPAVLTGAAVFVAILFSTSTVLAAADWLNGGASVFRLGVDYQRDGGALVVPQPFVWFAPVLVPFLLLAGLAVGWLQLRFRRRVAPAIDGLTFAEYSDLETRQVARLARHTAAFVHRAETTVGVVAFLALVAGLVAVSGALTDRPPGELLWRWLTQAGLWLSIGLASALLVLGARMRGSESTRRAIGVLWDLSTFWPRAAHPFAPPCYGERVVPELCHRIGWALRAGPRQKVVLSGHSQGSTISAATALQLCRADLAGAAVDRLHLITYGSQLRTWFGRIFPAVLGPEVLGNVPTRRTTFAAAEPDVPASGVEPPVRTTRTLAERLAVDSSAPRWINLYRRSDPLGFRVHADGDTGNPLDRYVPETRLNDPGDPNQVPPVLTHSDYPGSPEYAAAVRPWLHP